MKTSYKLAANYNVVEIQDIDVEKDLLEYLDWDTEVFYDPEGNPFWDVPYDDLLRRMLQHQYDIIAGIQVVPSMTGSKPVEKAAEVEKPTEGQIKWAKNLGMKDPEKRSKREVWEYIQKNKNK